VRLRRVAFATALTLSLAAGWAPPANALLWTFDVTLDGAQERPTPVATAATGTATVTFDDQTGLMEVTGSFANLTSIANNAHVHGFAPLGNPGDPATTGPPIVNLQFTAATSGTISGSGTIAAGNIAAVLAGLTYINVHSVDFPAGEIRGQLVDPIPEPASALLLLSGVAALALRRRAGRR